MNVGSWVFVCGPSGAGKDSLLGAARAQLNGTPGIVFPRRLVTRAAGPDAADDEISTASWLEREHDGTLAWSWEAHGIRYGIDIAAAGAMADGAVVVVNGSRQHVAALPASPHLRRVLVIAPPEVLARRLRERGREGEAAIAARLARNDQLAALQADLVIENTGAVEAGARELARYLATLRTG